MDLQLSISNGIVSSKIYDKCDDFEFNIVNFTFFEWRFFHVAPLMECIFLNLQERFDRLCTHVEDFNARNKFLMAKLLKQG